MDRLKKFLRRMRVPIAITVVVALLLMLSPIDVQTNFLSESIGKPALTIGQHQITFTIGTEAHCNLSR